MKKINYKFILLFLLTALILSCKEESSTEPRLEVDPKLVGTWELTKIITNIGGQDVELTPEFAGLASTVTFNSDLTFESTNTDSDGTTQDNGTWGTSNGNLTIHIDGDEPETTPYEFIDDTNVSIVNIVNIEGAGEVFATLIFTKVNG